MLMGGQRVHQVLPRMGAHDPRGLPSSSKGCAWPWGSQGARPEGGLPWWSHWLPGSSSQAQADGGGGGMMR